MSRPHSHSNTKNRLHDLHERIQRGQAGSEDLLALIPCVEEIVAGLEKPRGEVARSVRGLKNQQRIGRDGCQTRRGGVAFALRRAMVRPVGRSTGLGGSSLQSESDAHRRGSLASVRRVEASRGGRRLDDRRVAAARFGIVRGSRWTAAIWVSGSSNGGGASDRFFCIRLFTPCFSRRAPSGTSSLPTRRGSKESRTPSPPASGSRTAANNFHGGPCAVF